MKKPATDKPADYAIRWLVRRDMAAVLTIEQECFEYQWTEEDFLSCLRVRECIGMVAENRADGQIVGFMIYQLEKPRIRLLNFAVAQFWQRRGVGRAMVRRLKDKLSQQRRKEIALEVRETNLDAQRFFRSQGFKAIGVLRDRYDDTTEDAYLMRYCVPGGEPFHELLGINRIAGLIGGES